jgi:uncharacterized protein YjaG (DUF416 family)
MAFKEIALLEKLNFKKQLAFAYLCSERFFPNYQFFFENYNFGNPDILRTAIDYVYESIFDTIKEQSTDPLLEQIHINIPHTNNFTTFYAGIAMYSSGIVYESVNLIKQLEVSRILDDISTMCTDAVDLFIQERDDMDYEDPEFETKISNDHLMKQEIAIQKGIITYLSKINEISISDINTLLELQKQGTQALIIL